MDTVEALRISKKAPDADDRAVSWTVVLAAGERPELAEYVEHRFGQRLPKQYCCLLGNRSMLQHTLARTNILAPSARTLTVIGRNHAELALPQLVDLCDHVFRQPASRDTGIGFYVALAMIKRWCPNAVVTVTPSDHYVSPASTYVDVMRRAQSVAMRTGRVVLLGAKAVESDPHLGYIVRADRLTEVPAARSVVSVVEKPSVSEATRLRRAGALWNTMVACGTVEAFWTLGRDAEPDLLAMLDAVVPLIGTAHEDHAIESVYQAYLPVSFSTDILQRAATNLAVMELAGVEWSDWATPERIEQRDPARSSSV